MKKFELLRFSNPDDLAQAAATAWLEQAAAAKKDGRLFCVALSGGRIASHLFASTVKEAKERRISFDCVHFFWADERCVPPTDAESNFKTAKELLLAPLKIPDEQIHRIRGEEMPEIAARQASEDLRQTAPSNPEGRPVLDLVFLGMGEDGHVASLFPQEEVPEALPGRQAYQTVRHAPKPPPLRITLDYSTLAAARNAWVLVSGAGKEKALKNSLAPGEKTPLGRLLELRKNTHILLDFNILLQ